MSLIRMTQRIQPMDGGVEVDDLAMPLSGDAEGHRRIHEAGMIPIQAGVCNSDSNTISIQSQSCKSVRGRDSSDRSPCGIVPSRRWGDLFDPEQTWHIRDHVDRSAGPRRFQDNGKRIPLK